MSDFYASGKFEFFTGSPEASWLWRFPDARWMVSDTRLSRVKRYRRALRPWFGDSGGFSRLRTTGRWEETDGTAITPERYAKRVTRYADEIGKLDVVAVQDWMCEAPIRNGGNFGGMHFVGTGKSTKEHVHRSVGSYFDLMAIDPFLPWLPTLQGDKPEDYLYCYELFLKHGVDLSTVPRVGLGSVCRRQSTTEILAIMDVLAPLNLPIHGFGVKTLSLTGWMGDRIGRFFRSSDSQAWSLSARREGIVMDGCTHTNCANCPRWAVEWTNQLTARIPLNTQVV